MKKDSPEYYEKKFHILFDKLLIKEGFIEEVKTIRKEFGMPEQGFQNEPELAHFLIKKMTRSEQQTLNFYAFVEAYAYEKKIVVTEENRKEVIDAYIKAGNKKTKDVGMLPMIFELGKTIIDHNNLFTGNPLFSKNKFLSKLRPTVIKLLNKYWGFDLLDEHITVHLIEKYLFLDKNGVNQYIKHKVNCSSCRYIGVTHFSPIRASMKGQDTGLFDGKYLFNDDTVRLLSSHFNSVFLIVKPYAVKEQVIQYIEDNWEHLKEHIIEKNTYYKQFGINPSKIKESNTEQNETIYQLYKLPKKELLEKYKGEKDLSLPGIYKETIISEILKEYDVEMTPDAIKKAATRFAKSVKLKREPKDIRDI